MRMPLLVGSIFTAASLFCVVQSLPVWATDLVKPPQIKVIAHRGGRMFAPENTMTAFRKSLELKVDGIELDIHRCKTGELVVIHDESLERTTDGEGFVVDKTLAELKKLDAGSWYDAKFKNERLPVLSEVLTLIDGQCDLNIEIKNGYKVYPGIEDDLLKLLADYPYPEKITISSFDHRCLLNIHKRTKRYRLAMLIDGLMVDLPEYSHSIGVTNWHPGFSNICAESVRQAHEAGLSVNSWTVNGERDWHAHQR